MNTVRRHWNEIIDKLKGDVNQQYVQCENFIRNIRSAFELRLVAEVGIYLVVLNIWGVSG
jgi:hypothetical protein